MLRGDHPVKYEGETNLSSHRRSHRYQGVAEPMLTIVSLCDRLNPGSRTSKAASRDGPTEFELSVVAGTGFGQYRTNQSSAQFLGNSLR